MFLERVPQPVDQGDNVFLCVVETETRSRGGVDLKVFVAADADERIVRRIRRNLAAGAGLDGICDFYLDSVRYRHREFCEPTRAHADVVVPGGQDEQEGRERALEDVCGRVRAALGAGPERAGREQTAR